MRTIIKKLISVLPQTTQHWFFEMIELHYYKKTLEKIHKRVVANQNRPVKNSSDKKNILFYHLSGMSFGGTEKFLQILAKHIDKEKYNVFFAYSSKSRDLQNLNRIDGRIDYLSNSNVKLIDFNFDEMEMSFPYFVKGTNPHIQDVISENNIDLFVTAGSGYAEFPINIIRKTPIFLLNIFGSPIRQKNVSKNICISEAVKDKTYPITNPDTLEVMYIPSEGPDAEAHIRGKALRDSFKIGDDEFIFGRIGRGDDTIFDPIGINAFKQIVGVNKKAHYLIMSPPPILRKIVSEEKIPNVHFLDSTSNEKDIWTFHSAIDCLAHFRLDGESCGLNIIEAMLSRKPVISHRSKIWNAHLEYLLPEFSKVADVSDSSTYAKYMTEFILQKEKGEIKTTGELSYKKAVEIALIDSQIKRFEKWLEETLVKI